MAQKEDRGQVHLTIYKHDWATGGWKPIRYQKNTLGPIASKQEAYEAAEVYSTDEGGSFELIIVSSKPLGRGLRYGVWFEGERIR
jgi:hypothetical protein